MMDETDKSRSVDRPVVLAILGIVALLVLAYVVLTALDKQVDPGVWIAVSTGLGLVGGWIGGRRSSGAAPVSHDAQPASVTGPVVAPLAVGSAYREPTNPEDVIA